MKTITPTRRRRMDTIDTLAPPVNGAGSLESLLGHHQVEDLPGVLGEVELLVTLLARTQQTLIVSLEGDRRDLQRVCEQAGIILGLTVHQFHRLLPLAYRLGAQGPRDQPVDDGASDAGLG